MADESQPVVTVVIPLYNEREHICTCLDSLLKQDYPAAHLETLVVDGGSDDGSQTVVQGFAARQSGIHLLHNPQRVTPAAMNIGIQQAHGEVIIILSAHSFVAPDFVRQNVACLAQTGAACVGGPTHSLAETAVGQSISLAMSSPFGVGNARFRYSQRPQFVDTLAFGAYRHQVFEEIGLFDEALVYNEDDEFNYRLRRHGGQIFLSPAIRSFYYTRPCLAELWRQYFRYGRGKIRVFQRHPETVQLRHVVPALFVSGLLVSGAFAFSQPFFRWLGLALLLSYAIAASLFATLIARCHGWRHLPWLPLIFACLHLSYGSGFLWGMGRAGWLALHRFNGGSSAPPAPARLAAPGSPDAVGYLVKDSYDDRTNDSR